MLNSDRKVTHSRPFLSYLATSFLGAFNDNFFKLLLMCFATTCLSETAQKNYIPLAGGVFVLPFLVCSGWAGYVSDRVTKRRVILWAKWLELVVMTLGFFCFAAGAIYWLLLVLFLMGAQSALYSPAKYGYLPETLPERELSSGNGMTQLCTFLAILAGTWAGGVLATKDGSHAWLGGVYCMVVAAAGVFVSYGCGKTREGDPEARFRMNPLGGHLETARLVCKNRTLVFSLLGNTYFWFVAALYQNNLPLLVKQELHFGNLELSWLLGAVGLGIGLGCATCGALSRGKIEFGLVLPGGFLMACSCLLGGVAGHSLAMWLCVSLSLGFFAGIYQIPLSTSFQKQSPASRRGSCLALGNAVDCISMLLAYIFQWILIRPLGFRPSNVYVAAGIVTLGVLFMMQRKVPTLGKRTKEILIGG
ncbi:MAG: MFS transporter [Victivallales bacterium]|nr:MFS transporter [Victivallales bacterium]